MDGRFQCVSVKINYALTDVEVADGCFAVIPGSHKSNFANPLVGQVPDPDHPLVEPVPCRVGDAVLFPEDLSHGAGANRRRVWRTLFYSYAPTFHAAWGNLARTADRFTDRASDTRRKLVRPPAPFAEESALA